MAKQTKAFKKYKRNKPLQSARVRARKAQKKIYEKQMGVERRLMEEQFSDSDHEERSDEQRYLQLSRQAQQERSARRRRRRQRMDGGDEDPLVAEMGQFMDMLSQGRNEEGGDREEGDVDVDVGGVMEAAEVRQWAREVAAVQGGESGVVKRVALRDEHVQSWVDALEERQDPGVLKKLLVAFHVAVHGREDEDTPLHSDVEDGEEGDSGAGFPYYFHTEEQSLRVIVAAVKYTTGVLDHLCGLDGDENEDGMEVEAEGEDGGAAKGKCTQKNKQKRTMDEDDQIVLKKRKIPNVTGKRYPLVANIVKYFLSTLLHLFETFDHIVELSVALKFLSRALPYFGHTQSFTLRLLRCMFDLLRHDEELIRFRAFLAIREMAVVYPYPFLDHCLKGTYFTLVEHSLGSNDAHKHQIAEFLKDCIVELYGLDLNRSYHHSFIYVRELAITLRRALEFKPHNHLIVYNWRFVSCVDTWCRVICAHHDSGEMSELTYPLVQILIGMCQVKQSVKFVPAVLKSLQMLITLARELSIFIPIGPIIMNLLDRKEFTADFKDRAPAPLDTDFTLRVTKKSMSTKDFQDYFHSEIVFTILDYMQIYCHSISFPEMAYPMLRFIGQALKKADLSSSATKKFKSLSQKIADTCQLVSKKRMASEFDLRELQKKAGQGAQIDRFIEGRTPLDDTHERMSTLRVQELQVRIDMKLRQEREEMEEDDNESISQQGKTLKRMRGGNDNDGDDDDDGSENEDISSRMDQSSDSDEDAKVQVQPVPKKPKVSKANPDKKIGKEKNKENKERKSKQKVGQAKKKSKSQ